MAAPSSSITRMESRFARPGEMLYNLEVHNEHVYQVTNAGILVHNTCHDILMFGGRPIGTPGSRPTVREVPGGLPEAQNMFDDLAQGGTPITRPGYPGTAVQPPEGGFIGLRPVSGSGGPAIDVNVPGIPEIEKIHFE